MIYKLIIALGMSAFFSPLGLAYTIKKATAPAVKHSGLKELQNLSSGVAEVAEKATKAIVFLSVYKNVKNLPNDSFDPLDFFFGQRPDGKSATPRRRGGVGSGFFIDLDKGYILTNNHVVSGADEIELKLANDKIYKGKIVGRDKNTDVAVVQVIDLSYDKKGLGSLAMGSSGKMRVGDFVVALGAPYGLEASLSFGVISAIGRGNLDIANLGDFIQTDAAINPGNSGGPLLNIEGNVIGINTAIYSKTGGYNGIGFSVPSDLAVNIAEQLITSGRIQRGYLGVWMKPIDDELKRGLDIPENIEGTLVFRIAKNSPADRAGLEPGDVIYQIDSHTTKNASTIANAVGLKKPGTKIRLGLYRDGKPLVVKVTTDKHPEDKLAEDDFKQLPFGLTLSNWSKKFKKEFGLKSNFGVFVRHVLAGSAADRSGIKPGDLILRVADTKVKSVKQFHKISDSQSSLLIRIERTGQFFMIKLRK